MTRSERFSEADAQARSILDQIEAYAETVAALVAEYTPSEFQRSHLLGDVAHRSTGARSHVQILSTIPSRLNGLSWVLDSAIHERKAS